MTRNKIIWIVVAVLIVLGGGYVAYTYKIAPEQTEEGEAVLQTAAVTVGDISITAAGTGVLVASSELDLAFSSNGTLEGLLVAVGDRVQAGDTLAWIDAAEARQAVAEAELQVMEAEQALAVAAAKAELEAAQAKANLDAARNDLDTLLKPAENDIKLAKAELYSAQASYRNTADKASMYEDQTASSRINLDQAIAALADAQSNYVTVMDAARDFERNIDDTRESARGSLVKAQQNLEIAQAGYNLDKIDSSTADVQSAWAKVLSAQSALETLESPSEADITAAQIAVQEMEIAFQQAELGMEKLDSGQTVAVREAEIALEQATLKLEAAQEALERTTLVAPFAGTVVEIAYDVGETVSGAAIVLADLETPVVQFWVEESDLSNVAVGNRVDIVFEALPDLSYTGEIYQVDPVLVEVSGISAVQAWASINSDEHPVDLLGDMNVEIEIVAGEALSALLVPVQALRTLGGDQYAVFVVQTSGELEMRMVEVGLKDFANAEIKSGLARGEIISLGEGTSTTSSSSQSDTQDTPFQQGPIPGMIGGPPGPGG